MKTMMIKKLTPLSNLIYVSTLAFIFFYRAIMFCLKVATLRKLLKFATKV